MTYDTKLHTAPGRTEADSIAEVARQGATPTILTPGQIHAIPTATGVHIENLDLDEYRDTPRRKTGTVEVEDVTSFLTYWHKHADDASELYVNVKQHFLTAVLDAHATTGPRWGQHRLILRLKTTDRWKAWTGNDRRPLTQEEFANHIEDHLDDIREPAAAEMLEIAQTFQATTNATFKSNIRLASGQFTLNWEESVNATAGEAGQKAVPATFVIGIAPFDFAAAYRLNARFRYRVKGGKLSVAYLLDDPAAVVRDAVLDVVGQIEKALSPEWQEGSETPPSFKILRGTPA